MLSLLTMFARRWPLAALALGAATGLHAQRPDPFASLVSEALRNNLGLGTERLAEARVAAELREARGYFFPSLSLDGRYTRQSGTLNLGDIVNPAYSALNQLIGSQRFPTSLDLTIPLAFDARVRLTQPLFNETIRRNHQLARRRLDGQHAHRLAAARRLAAETQTAYLTLADARSAVEIYRAALTLVAENERVAERLLAAGQATPDAVFRAHAERSEVAQKLAEAEEQRDAAARAFNRVVGRALDTPVPALADSVLEFDFALTEDEAIRHALADREELAEGDAGIAMADAAVGLAGAGYLPTLGIALDYGFQSQRIRVSGNNDYAAASVVLSWSAFNGGRDLARRQAASDDAQRARLARQDLQDRIVLEVRQAWGAAKVARAAIATADDRLTAARRTFELVRRRYQEGVASQIEFLDARTALTNAELNRTLTAHRYAIAYVNLERAAALRVID